MSFETATAAIASHLNGTGSDEVEISFHGGEPFLEFELIKEICEWTWRHQWKLPYVFFVTTNGTVISEGIKRWLEAHREKFYCCISLDGNGDIHNTNRPGSYEEIDIPFFRQTWPDQPAKMTISVQTLPKLAESVTFLHSLGIDFHGNVAYFSDWQDVPRLVEVFAEQLATLAHWYLAHPTQKPCNLLALPLHVLGYDLLHPLEKHDHNSPWCGFGRTMAAVGIDGRTYPCHVLIPFGEHGATHEGSNYWYDSDAEAETKLMDISCAGCLLTSICPTCYAANLQMRGSVELRDPTECEFFKIRCQASAYLYGEMLTSEVINYAELSDSDPARKRLIVEAVLAIQDYAPTFLKGNRSSSQLGIMPANNLEQ